MACSESLIALVHSKPDLWDHSNTNYSSKSRKIKSWESIGEKLNLSPEVAKMRWTNLRDLFRRELKKMLRVIEETGDPNSHKPRWKHFKSMLFLKDQMVKDDRPNSIELEDSYTLYPQTILEDGSGVKIEDECFAEAESSPNSTPSYQENSILPTSSRKRAKESNDDQQQVSNKRQHWSNQVEYGSYEAYDPRPIHEMDEDYHFLMSILPSMRRIRHDRKTSFKMKILQLIVDEENVEST